MFFIIMSCILLVLFCVLFCDFLKIGFFWVLFFNVFFGVLRKNNLPDYHGGGIDLVQYSLNYYSSVLLADTYVFKTFKFGSRVKEHQETSHTVGINSK